MSTVVLKRCEQYDQDLLRKALDEGMELLGGWERFVKSGQKVLLKVNMIGPVSPDRAATTHPEFVRAVVRAVKAQGAEAWVGDSAGGAIAGISPTAKALEVCGYAQVCREEGARLINFDSEGAVPVPSKTGRFFKEFYIAKAIVDADVVINLPKFKCHSAQLYTGAVKNLFGSLPGLSKATYHKTAPNHDDFGELIADIHRACGVDLNLMDAVVGHEGNGPTAGSPHPVGALLMATDPVALDAVGCRMMGIEASQVPTVRQAEIMGLGTLKLSEIELEGDYQEIPRIANWKLPSGIGMKGPSWMLKAVIGFFKTQPLVDRQKCRDCNMCVDSCPVNAIDRTNKKINYETCIECLCCHELCQFHAVKLHRANPLAQMMMRGRD